MTSIPTISWATREVPLFSITVMIGLRIARLKAGEKVRFRLYQRSDNNGSQVAVSQYVMHGTLEAVKDAVTREQWPVVVQSDGIGIVVERRIGQQ